MPRQLRHRAGRGQCGQRRDRRGQLADVVQVDVEARRSRRRALHLEVRIALAHSRTDHLEDVEDGVGRLHADRGQPVTRTVPPVTTAAARNGTAFDRSGSMTQCRGGDRAGRDPPAVGRRVVDRRRRPRAASPPSSRCAAPTAPTSPVCTTVSPSRERRAGQQQAGDELRRRRRVDLDRAARAPPRCRAPRTAAPSPSMSTPRPRSAVEQRRDRAGPGLLVAVERRRPRCSARPPAGRTATPCRPGRSRCGRRGCGASAPLTVSSVPVAVDVERRASAARRSSGRCRGCAARR